MSTAGYLVAGSVYTTKYILAQQHGALIFAVQFADSLVAIPRD
jgi:hypothetical protein